MATISHTVVEIYVSGHCFISDYTHEVIEGIHREFPQVEVHLIDIDQTAEVPDSVFATPTYLLNGWVWSLGNPSLDKVRETFA